MQQDTFLLMKATQSYGMSYSSIEASFSKLEEATRIKNEFNDRIEGEDRYHQVHYYIEYIPKREIDLYEKYIVRAISSQRAYIEKDKISYSKIERDFPELMTRKKAKEENFKILKEEINYEKRTACIEIQTLDVKRTQRKLKLIAEKTLNKFRMAQEMLK